mgnify:CR=1 FL=1
MYSNRICGLKARCQKNCIRQILKLRATCVAPDYIYVQDSIKDHLVKELINETKRQFTDSPLNNNDYGKMLMKSILTEYQVLSIIVKSFLVVHQMQILCVLNHDNG